MFQTKADRMLIYSFRCIHSLFQEYQPEWLLPPESEVAQWFEMKNTHYPSAGEPGFIMIKQIDIANEFEKFDEMVDRLRSPEQRWNINKVQPWHNGFRKDIHSHDYIC